MSIRTMARVWDLSRHAGTDLLMLLAIADFADDDGNAYPAVSTLALKCRMKPRNCRYLLRSLEQSGELSVVLNAGPKGANLYRINLDALGMQHSAGVQNLAGVQCSAATPAKDCRKPLQRSAAKPSVNHQDSSVNARETKNLSRSFDAKAYLFVLNVPDQIATDWLSLRKTKKALPTKTAIDGILKQAERAGITLGDALALCCERGWQGFRADWIKDQNHLLPSVTSGGRSGLFDGAL